MGLNFDLKTEGTIEAVIIAETCRGFVPVPGQGPPGPQGTRGADGESEKDVNFYTPYGELVAAWTLAEAQAATTLPNAPVLDRLIFQEWNWTLADIKAHKRPLDVGGSYVTVSGKSEFDMRFNAVTGLSTTIRIYNVSGNLSIEWGDGMTDQSSSTGMVSFTHTYSSAGIFTISVDSTGSYYPYGSSATPFNVFGLAPNNRCVAIRLGIRCNYVESYAFRQLLNLRQITFPMSLTAMGTYVFHSCRLLENVVLPRQITNIGSNMFYGGYSLKRVVLPNGIVSIDNAVFNACVGLQRTILPDGILSIPDSSFISKYYMQSMVIPSSVTSINANAFSSFNAGLEFILLPAVPPVLANVNAFGNINQLCEIKVPQGSLSAYKSAANWITYANHIVELTNDEMIKYGLAVA